MNIKLLSARYSSRLFTLALGLLCTALLIASPRAQQTTAPAKQSPEDRVELYQALLDLTNPWTVMCIAAHPDDEDGTSLIVMRRKYGAHTVSLFSTFGEGGQNAIGPELYEELGAIRVRETMAAAEIQGSEPHFLGLKDFGYSKSADEAFKFWGHDEALRRMVLEIRKLRPDVIITNHSVTNNDHGHHQATARLEVEAFDAAADSKHFPEQLTNGITVWQVQRLFVRNRGNAQADTAPVVTIDPNEQDPIRGVVYAEEALRALQKHATQGPWPKTFAEYATRFRAFSGQPGGAPGQLPPIRYRLVREAKGIGALPRDSHNFLDGLKLSAAGALELPLPDLSSTMDALNDLSRTRGKIIEAYREGWNGVGHVYDDPQRRELMRRKMERAAALAAGLHFDAQIPNAPVIANETLNVPIKVVNTGPEPVSGLTCSSATAATGINQAALSKMRVNHTRMGAESALAPGTSTTVVEKLLIPSGAKINVPVAQHLYEPTALGLNENVRCAYEIDKTRLGVDLPLRVDVAPLVEIAKVTPDPAPIATDKPAERSSQIKVPFEVTLMNHQGLPFNGRLAAVEGTFGNPINDMALKLAPGEKRTVKFLLDGPVTHIKHNSVAFLVKDARWSSPPTSVPIFATDAQVAPRLRVGYVRGFDFSLPNALAALGVESKELVVDEVKTSDLQKYSTIIVDNRVYESTPELIAANQKLLDYANNGGTLIVFYHKSFEWNPDTRRNRPQLGPYPLTLGDERITDENAPITFIEADHPLLNFPNKMGQEDFVGWIQERGLYYPKDWDAHYHALLQSNDPGEAPLKGGLLVADYGRGHYIYTSMVWYRQLRAGVPGAYRMLANMISFGHASEGKR